MNFLKRFFITSGIVLLAYIGFYTIYSIMFFNVQGIYGGFLAEYNINNIIINCIIALPVLFLAIYFITGSFVNKENLSAMDFQKNLVKIVFLLITCTTLVILVNEVFTPIIARRQEDIKLASLRYTAALTEGELAIKEKNLTKAKQMLFILASIDPKGKITQEYRFSVGKLESEDRSNQALNTETLITNNIQNAATYFKSAQDFYQKGDFYSAHYYYLLAFSLDSSREDARQEASNCWNIIIAKGMSEEDKNKRKYELDKREAYSALISTDYENAYRIFSELSIQNEKDKEVAKYLIESKEKLEKVSVFLDEYNTNLRFVNADNVFFSLDFEAGKKLFIASDGIACFRDTVYFQNLVYMIINNGEIIHKITAPYAKLHTVNTKKNDEGASISTNKLYLRTIDRSNKFQVIRPNFEIGKSLSIFENILEIPISTDQVSLISLKQLNMNDWSIFDFISIQNAKGLHYFDLKEIRKNIEFRILLPLFLMCLWLLALITGFLLRDHKQKRSAFIFIMVGFLLLLCAFPVYEVFISSLNTLIQFADKVFDPYFSIIFVASVGTCLLVLCFLKIGKIQKE